MAKRRYQRRSNRRRSSRRSFKRRMNKFKKTSYDGVYYAKCFTTIPLKVGNELDDDGLRITNY